MEPNRAQLQSHLESMFIGMAQIRKFLDLLSGRSRKLSYSSTH